MTLASSLYPASRLNMSNRSFASLLMLLLALSTLMFSRPSLAEEAAPTIEVRMARILTVYYAQQGQRQQYFNMPATAHAPLEPPDTRLESASTAAVAVSATPARTAAPQVTYSLKKQQPRPQEDWYTSSTEWGWCPVTTTTICDQCCETYWPSTTTVYCNWCATSTTTVTVEEQAQPTTVYWQPAPTTAYQCEECEHNYYCTTLYETGPGLPTSRPGWCGTILILEAGTTGTRDALSWSLLLGAALGTVIFTVL